MFLDERAAALLVFLVCLLGFICIACVTLCIFNENERAREKDRRRLLKEKQETTAYKAAYKAAFESELKKLTEEYEKHSKITSTGKGK